ncbi:MAG: DUF4112 domain-containing protein [Pirellulales bacterium]
MEPRLGTPQTWPKRRIYAAADDDRLSHVERIARLLDNEYRLPGTNFRFGLDPILGLIPGVGNMATSLVSCLLVWTMLKHGASGNVAARMAVNIAFDSIIGAIPIVGNLFDFAYKSNQKNVELLRRHYSEGAYQGSGVGILLAAAAAIFTVLAVAAWAVFSMLAWLFHLLF